MRRLLATSLLFGACLLALAGQASAHALLESSSPARGAQLKNPPTHVNFVFDEPVEASLGAVRVFNTSGDQVQSDDLERPGENADAVGAGLPADLPDGLYTATYHVISADSHPVSGGITFTVGKPGKDLTGFTQSKTISELLAESEAGKVTEVAFWADRWVGYLAIALAVGALAWMLLVWGPVSTAAGIDRRVVERRFRKLILVAATGGLLVSLLAIIFQGSIGAGTSFWDAFGSGIPGEVIHTRFGSVMLVRSGLWVLLAGLAFFGSSYFSRPGPVPIVAVLVGVSLAATPAFAGHASTRDPGWLLIPSDITHVIAMAVWAGGLAAMLVLLPAVTRQLHEPAERTRVLTRATLRFSTVAFVAVALIGVTGAIQAIIEVGSVPDLFDTQFGRAVLIKIILFAALIALGAANRTRIIPGLVRRLDHSESPGRPGNRLRQSLRLEVILVTVVLGVTAALVSYPPPDSIQSGPSSGAVGVEGQRLEYTVDPARVGVNEVHLYVFNDRTGAPVKVRSMDVSFALPSAGIAPIEAVARRAGPGHFVVPSAMLGVKGEWQAEVAIRLSEFEEPIAGFKVDVR
ncbi:MAG: CopD family protein [Thermoleophilales bacterium]|nr:CopD family protein [Thermoleophilales bacterium]